MKKFSLWCSTGVMALAFAAGAQAHGDVKCEEIPKSQWKPQADLQKKLTAEGWKVRKLKSYHGCYEVYGFDAKGARVEAFFNPGTLERVEASAVKK